MAYTPETAFALEPEYAPFAEQNQPPPIYVRPATVVAAETAAETNAVSGIVTPADFITEDGGDGGGANSEEGADGTATSEPPPPPPPGDAGGEMGYRRR
jgi:hypothetical protein